MTKPNNRFDLSKFVNAPFVGDAFFSANHGRCEGKPFFFGERHRVDDSCDDAGMAIKGTGDLSGITLHAGNLMLALDRPRVGNADSRSVPMVGTVASWAFLGAPLTATAAILGGLIGGTIGGLFTRFIAAPMGWTVDRAALREAEGQPSA